MIRIILPHKVSTNVFYNMHFSKRARVIIDFHKEVFLNVKKNKILPITVYPIHSKYHFFFAKRPVDAINLSGMVKAIEDGFRACGVLVDDDPKCVSAITLVTGKSAEKFDYCEVELSI